MVKKQSFFEKKSVVATFGVLALLSGIFFVRPKGVTGNIILSSRSVVDLTSIIGLLLLICSAILLAYAIARTK